MTNHSRCWSELIPVLNACKLARTSAFTSPSGAVLDCDCPPEDNYLRNMHPLTLCINLRSKYQEPGISTAATTRSQDRNASARAFIHSLNILVKYVRLYGFQHKRTEGQFEVTWNELQHGLPDIGFLLGVSENRLLLD